MITRRTVLAAGVATASLARVGRAAADDTAPYPSKTVKIVVSTPAGSQQDTLGRLVAESLNKTLGQPFIVMNVPGAGSVASAAYVAKAPADGYTILIANAAPMGIAHALRSDLTYNPDTDFIPVSELTESFFMVVENPKNIPAATLPDLITLLKASPGKYNFASSGIGGMVHMQTELFMSKTGTKMTHVPYTSSGEVTNSLVSGYTDLAVDTTDALPQVKAGQLRALAVTSDQRLADLPDVPTIKELIPNYGEAAVWQGVFVPAGTPGPVVDKLNAAIKIFLQDPDMIAKLKALALTPAYSTPEKFAALVKSDAATWAGVIKSNGIKPQ